jgi:aminopeptidase-like protein
MQLMDSRIKKYYDIAKIKLYPICRSLTGNGTRETLKIIKKHFPKLKIFKEKSGKKVFDWNIPPEWNIQNAYVIDKFGNKIIDFKKNNLHIVGYSIPVNKKIKKDELFNHLHSIPNQPKAIPYITSYYKRYWGFCVSDEKKKLFQKKYSKKDKFKVVIDSNLNKFGFLNYGELLIKGKSKKEILISTYICHPSMANNELSGPIVSMCLIDFFKRFKKLEKTLRFIFIPETIGSITYLSKNLKKLKKNIIGGYNLSCIGDERNYSCMFSKYNNTQADKALRLAYKKLKIKFKSYSFLKRGSDERQYCSPSVDLPVASIFRTKYGEYPEYHTSLDNFKLVTKKGILGGFNVSKKAIEILLKTSIPKNRIICEPQMGKRNLYPNLSTKQPKNETRNLMNFLQYADGKNSLEEISKLIKLNFNKTKRVYDQLKKNNLVD